MNATGSVDHAACASRLERALTRMARYSEAGDGVTRLSLTPTYFDALADVQRELEELGFQHRLDPVGNLVASNVPDDVPCIALGSHIDSVPHGGAYDGTAGVLCALEVARALPDQPLKIISFVSEEGSRFGSGLLGSRCMAGLADSDELRRHKDRAGVSFFDAARAAGLDPARVGDAKKALTNVTAFFEIHIEQGRVLEEEELELGVVTDIVGLAHTTLTVTGRADHAGATPMNLRSDSAITAAEIVLELERLARATTSTSVATVGVLELEPGARNVIPGVARVGMDVRDRSRDSMDGILDGIVAFARGRAASRGQQVSYTEHLRTEPVALGADPIERLDGAAQRLGLRFRRMVSGGGHDAMMIAQHVPTGMLFVPCRDGVSHAPNEHASPEHLASAVAVVADAVTTYDQPAHG